MNTSNEKNQSQFEHNQILVAYFSHSGNTYAIARHVQERMGGDIFEIVAVDPYPRNYQHCVDQARKELDEQYRPSLKTKVENMDTYDLVFVGYPNWWGTIPMPVASFLSEYDFSGKTIAPFCTHGGGRLGRSVTDISNLCRQSTVLEGLAIRGGAVSSVQNDVLQWLKEKGLLGD